ncbi:MAG: hypothetical protein GOV02_01465, partial [Candidatus Aenigmarchaeota archaeon]|nr:hypothetical protein [Candidatus Aenigmarchaeota archaeon]
MNKAKRPAIGFDIDRTVYPNDPGLEEAIFLAKVKVASKRYGWRNSPIYYSTQVEEMMKENPEGYKDFAHSIDRIAVH